MGIAIIHPSRQRAHKSLSTIKRWRETADEYVKVFVSLDTDDPTLGEYEEIYQITGILVSNNRSAVDAINRAANLAILQGYEILIVVSDDTEPIEHWDSYIKKTVDGKTDWILKTQDGIQPWIITFPILDRTYYNRFGYIYYTEYKHMFCDTELTMVADLTGRKITSNLLFPHKQYSVTGEKPDEVNKRADATWNQGEKLFLERLKNNFGLKPEDVKGKVTDPSYINWARSKGVMI